LQAGQTQNALAQYQLGAAQRADEVNTNFLRGVQSAGGDEGAIRQAYMGAGKIKEYQDFLKSQAEAAKLRGETANLELTGGEIKSRTATGLLGNKLKIAQVAGSILRGVKDQATYDMAKQSLGHLVPDAVTDYPAAFDPAFIASEMKAGQTLTEGLAAENAARVAATGEANVAATLRGQTITAGTAAANQQSQERIANLNRQQTLDLANRPVFNEAAQGFIGRPTTAAPGGTFTPMPAGQANKDQQAAVKALKSAGYDVTTGEDNISKLIEKSTSGRLQAGAAATLAFFDLTTEGRKAISALEGTANQIATDLAGGKLGAGISNTDRDFIVGALGDVSNPSKTSEERLAGWNAAKQRMVNTGLIPPPKPAAPNPSSSVSGKVTPAAGGNAPPPPPGFKPD
jgi:hypothetical protein